MHVLQHLAEQLGQLGRIFANECVGKLQVHSERNEMLHDAVVELAFDRTALIVGGIDHTHRTGIDSRHANSCP